MGGIARVRSPRWRRLAACAAGERVALLAILLAVTFGLAANGALHAGNYEMHRDGSGSGLIGYASAVQALGIVLAAPLMAFVVRAGRLANVAAAAGLLATTGFLGIFLAESAPATLSARFAFGCGIGLGMAFTEYLAVSRVRRDLRGYFGTLFGVLLAAGHALGALLTTQLSGTVMLASVTAAMALGCAVLAPWGRMPQEESQTRVRDLPRVFALSPAIFLAAALYGFLDNGFLTMLPDFYAAAGIAKEDAVIASFAAFAGICAFQIPAGHLASRFPAMALMRSAILALVVVVMLSMLLVHWAPLRPVFALVSGGLVDIVYTIGLVALAKTMPRRSMVSANACFVSMCGVGEVLGPAVTGPALQGFGLGGGATAILYLLAGYWIVAAYRSLPSAAIPAATPRIAL